MITNQQFEKYVNYSSIQLGLQGIPNPSFQDIALFLADQIVGGNPIREPDIDVFLHQQHITQIQQELPILQARIDAINQELGKP